MLGYIYAFHKGILCRDVIIHFDSKGRAMKKPTLLIIVVVSVNFLHVFFAGAFEGRVETALQFDGVNDYVYAPYIDAYKLLVFTYEAWILPTADSLDEYLQVVIDQGEDKMSDNHAARFYLGKKWQRTLALL